jgi:hypothetical protein
VRDKVVTHREEETHFFDEVKQLIEGGLRDLWILTTLLKNAIAGLCLNK